jgi:hypothetical protein
MPASSSSSDRNAFAQTRWSLIAAASAPVARDARGALVELCLRYWFPIYACVREAGHTPAEADDITRAFFDELVANRLSLPADARGGRFREFLQSQLRSFLDGDWRESVDSLPVPEFALAPRADSLESRYEANASTGGDTYARSCALAIIGVALDRLRAEAVQAGRADLFDALQPWLGREPAPAELDAIAHAHDLRPLALQLALRRLRERFRELADAELSDSVATADDLERERAALAQALARPP